MKFKQIDKNYFKIIDGHFVKGSFEKFKHTNGFIFIPVQQFGYSSKDLNEIVKKLNALNEEHPKRLYEPIKLDISSGV